MPKPQLLRDLLRDARERSGKRQDQIAAAMGVTQPCVTRWEGGQSMPRDLRRAAKVYGIDAARLIAAFVAERQRRAS